MIAQTLLSDIRTLTRQEKLLLVQEIWDEISAESEQVPLTSAQRDLLDERLKEHEDEPAAVSSWDDVWERVLSSL